VAKEVFKTELPLLSGAIPADMSGAYIKTGPNPYFQPAGGYHWFDGDGMVHACRIKDGRASYCNRWVETSRLQQERSAGWPMFGKLGDLAGFGGLAVLLLHKLRVAVGLVDMSKGAGTANTALAVHARRILALNESDLPYGLRLLCSGLLENVGRLTAGGQLSGSFTAHPKVRPL
jgi:carotenoid cleavage dioxygenase-like enzyme